MIHTVWANESYTAFEGEIYALKRGDFLRIWVGKEPIPLPGGVSRDR
jgi:hypothetical protein